MKTPERNFPPPGRRPKKGATQRESSEKSVAKFKNRGGKGVLREEVALTSPILWHNETAGKLRCFKKSEWYEQKGRGRKVKRAT